MDRSKDMVGYEINFTKYFYKYKPLRSVEEILTDLHRLEQESDGLFNELTMGGK
jgi:type I restriction enzyme M protein